MAQTQIAKLAPKHEAIMDWILANPHRRLGECAAAFGVSQSWLSVVIHSQIFRAKLAEKQQELFDCTVLPLRDKLNGVAHQALDALGEKVAAQGAAMETRTLLDIADKMAHRLGYAPTRGPEPASGPVQNQQNNYYIVDQEALRSARQKMESYRNQSREIEGGCALPSPS